MLLLFCGFVKTFFDFRLNLFYFAEKSRLIFGCTYVKIYVPYPSEFGCSVTKYSDASFGFVPKVAVGVKYVG